MALSVQTALGQVRLPKWAWTIGIVVIAYFVLKMAGLFAVKKVVEYQWSKRFPVKLHIGSIDYSLLGRTASVHGIRIRDGNTPIFSLSSAKVGLSLTSLLSGTKVIRFVKVSHPHFVFQKERQKDGGTHNLSKLLEHQKKQRAMASAEKGKAKKPFRMPFKVLVKKIRVTNFQFSYIEKYDDSKFQYVVDKGNMTITHFQYPGDVDSVMKVTMRFPKRGKGIYEGKLTSAKGVYHAEGTLKMTGLSAVALGAFMKHHFLITPKSGTASLTSKISIHGTEFRSSHDMRLKNFDVKISGGIVSTAVGLVGSTLIKGLNTVDGKALELQFRVDGDLASNTNWALLISQAISSAFYNKLNVLNSGESTSVQDKAQKVINIIEDLSPF